MDLVENTTKRRRMIEEPTTSNQTNYIKSNGKDCNDCNDENFMDTALSAAKQSKDPNLKVGACVVNQENKIVGIGFNSMPSGCSDDAFPWENYAVQKIDRKSLYVCHAEMNAILNTYKNCADVKNCTIYVSLFPCNECAKIIIQSGINEVVYKSDEKAEKVKYKASKRMLHAAGVNCRQFKPRND